MSVSARIWRLVAGLLSVGISLKMAGGIDGRVALDSAAARYAWVIVMFALLFFGVGSLAQVLRPALGKTELRWFPSEGGAAVRVLSVGIAILLVVWGVNSLKPQLTGRAAMGGAGLFTIYLAATRAPGFWDYPGSGLTPGVDDLRAVFGDRVVQIFYLLIGIALLAVAVFAHLSNAA